MTKLIGFGKFQTVDLGRVALAVDKRLAKGGDRIVDAGRRAVSHTFALVGQVVDLVVAQSRV